MLIAAAAAQAQSVQPEISAPGATQRCVSDVDCVPAPEIDSGCFHACTGQQCEGAKLCPPFNRASKNFPACTVRVECRLTPDRPVCINGKCQNRYER